MTISVWLEVDWWEARDSTPEPAVYKTGALTIELASQT